MIGHLIKILYRKLKGMSISVYIAIPGTPGPNLLGPGGLARRSWTSRARALAELLRRPSLAANCGDAIGPGDMLLFCCGRGPGESGRGV